MRRILLLSILLISVYTCSRDGGVKYAKDHVHNINHKCGTYSACIPCSYWGSEHCGYTSNGGDCANFVSQCVVLGGGHPNLKGSDNCRGYPCGFEEVGAKRLGFMLKRKRMEKILWTFTKTSK